MHADDVFRYGHLAVLDVLDRLPPSAWAPTGADAWTARDLLAHLAAYELLLGDIFASVLNERPTPTLDAFRADDATFNERQVAARRAHDAVAIRADYEAAHRRAAELLARIPSARRRQAGILPWYGADYDLEDVVAYMGYGHKTEHAAQLAAFAETPA